MKQNKQYNIPNCIVGRGGLTTFKHQRINLRKGGIIFSNIINTVFSDNSLYSIGMGGGQHLKFDTGSSLRISCEGGSKLEGDLRE